MKVDPRSIHVDQRKQDTRRDAWDRDYMPVNYTRPQGTKADMNIVPVYIFAFFFVCILILIDSIS